MSRTQQQYAQDTRSLTDEPTPDTDYDRRDIIENPFGRPYVVQSQYYSKHDSPMVHLRRQHGNHDMYVTETRLTEMIEDADWSHHPQ
jgi:hypothetical protein